MRGAQQHLASPAPPAPCAALAPVDAERTASCFAAALLGRDASAASAYFAPAARLVTPDGTEVVGREAIGELLAQLTSPDQGLEIRTGRTVQSEAFALATQYWKRVTRGARAEPFEQASIATLVLGLEDGRWQILIASPWR